MRENYKWYVKSVLVNPPYNEYRRWNLFDMSIDMCNHIYGDLWDYESECEEIFDEMYKSHSENKDEIKEIMKKWGEIKWEIE